VSSEIWAIVSAAVWAADSILVRKGTAFSNPSTAALISFSVNAVGLVPYILYLYPAEKIFQSANLFFVLSGIIQPAIVRVMFYVGIVRLGVSRAGPIRGTSPFFPLAFFVFRERPEVIVYLAGLLTIAGTWLVSYKRVGEAKWRAIDLLFPLGAAMLASVSQKIRKAGLNATNEPVIASTITTATSLVCLLGSLLFSGKTRSIKSIVRVCRSMAARQFSR
jgi:drug/metabolite transporter, DME family